MSRDPAGWLVDRASRLLDNRLSRRSFVTKATMVGTAVAASGCAVITQPGSPVTFVTDCGGGSLCRDGYTEFCCVINNGLNACPPDSIPSGWWRADYSPYCDGTRYYIDCNNYTGAGPCRCGNGCGTRKVYCNHFRYGQCNTWQPGTGVIACRVVTCTPPYQLNIGCDPSGAVDNSTANHYTDCSPYTPPPPPPPAVEVSLGAPVLVAPGIVEVFVRGVGGRVDYIRRDVSQTEWDAWETLGGVITSRVVAVTTAAGIVHTVARVQGNSMFERRFDGSTWSGWEALGGVFTSDPSAVAVGNEVFLFGRGQGNGFWWNRHDGASWLGWQDLGGVLTSDPTVAAAGSQVVLLGRALGNVMFENRFDGTTWSGWQSLGGVFTSDPTAVTVGAGVYVFARGQGNGFWWNRYDGASWLGWQNLGGVLTSDAAAAALGSQVILFGRGQGNVMFENRFDGTTWSGWQSLGGVFTSDPAAVTVGSEIFLFARGQGNGLWWNRFDGSAWSGWELLGGSIHSVRGAIAP